ncbi:sugar phosphate isomerase/epimerase family protein [Paenarthrobacter sp. NPDC092416]|uniref:sugar phosphate isomerase/epimerase family protein n=1 Tax=Paenarthrobacter sp. NPDC092416 TaxID=3364386 RepID=UPI0037F13B67
MAISTAAFPVAERADPSQSLRRAVELGFSGCHFHSIFEIDPQLSRERMTAVAQQASVLGQTLTAGLLFLSPTHPSRSPEVILAGRGHWDNGIHAVLDAAHEAGVMNLLAVVGKPEDRTSGPGRWKEQLSATVRLLSGVRGHLCENGQKIILKSHPEISSQELEEVIERVGADAVGVGFDPINVVARGENPVDAVSRLSGCITQIYIDDMVMLKDAGDLIRVPVPFGAGQIEWDQILSVLAARRTSPDWILDLKKDPTRIRVNDSEWLAAQGMSHDSARYCRALASGTQGLQANARGESALDAVREPTDRLSASIQELKRSFPAMRRDISVQLESK